MRPWLPLLGELRNFDGNSDLNGQFADFAKLRYKMFELV